ncbi:MAG TPA: tRNA 2-selenouridine(34) synthase MnmH [Bacteroidales bacterium]|nr:tRNA 2-selenouridine(34) synthase MnmH [Bacteroidales bacterium]
MGVSKIDVDSFLKLSEKIPVIDVRSPSEFLSGHIPGAVNIPLFNDDERATVGTRYKKAGRLQAILEGLRKAGPGMSEKLEKAIKASVNSELLVHCWRGGMRSEAMAWLFSLGDIKTQILDGGYKAYRSYILAKLTEKRKIIILGGLTGSGKTHILAKIKSEGHQVIDLEGLACHKGSAFGALGQATQPTTEHFANILFREWNGTDPDIPLWLEDESRNIGSVFMPDQFYSNMQETPAVILMMDMKTRMPRLMEEYSIYPPAELKASIMRISKRLGGDNTRDALEAVDRGDIAKAVEITLHYYDKAYMYGLKKKDNRKIILVETDTDDIGINTTKVLKAADSIKW